MKILGVQVGAKTIDDVIEVFAVAELELREIAQSKTLDAIDARARAEEQTQLANLRSGEAGRARGIADRIKLMLGGKNGENAVA